MPFVVPTSETTNPAPSTPPTSVSNNTYSTSPEPTNPPSYGEPEQESSNNSGFNGMSLVQSGGNPLTGVYGQPGAFGNPGFNGQSLVQTNGNPLGGVYAQPGAFGNPSAYKPPPPATDLTPPSFGQPGWQPTFRSDVGGYNPSQYATLDTSNALAKYLGGNVIQTQTGRGPFNVPSQNSIDFGLDSPLNAGLVADRYAKYDRATADQMTRDELALQRPRSGVDESFNNQFTPVAGGFQSGATENPFLASVTPRVQNTQPPVPQSPQAPLVQNNDILTQILSYIQQAQAPQPARTQYRNPFGNAGYYPSLPRFGQMKARQSQSQTNGFSPQMQQQLLSLLLGF